MRNPGGYAVITDPLAPTKEWDTFTCCHCNSIVNVKPFQAASDAGGWCARCAKPVCGPCADQGRCTPFEKKLDAYEARMRLRNMAG